MAQGTQEHNHTRIVVVQVTCLAEDAEDVKASLFNPDSRQPSWYYDHNCPLGPIKVEVRQPTRDEEVSGCKALDIEEREEP